MSLPKVVVTVALLAFANLCMMRTAVAAEPVEKKVLIVLSSLDKKATNLVGGYWLPELTHPVAVFDKAGVKFDLASPVGGFAPFDGFDLKDQATLDFWTNPEHRNRLGTTLRLADVNAADYASVLLVGGHGPMWDFVDNPRLDAVVRTIYEQGGLVSAVCHGPAGLLGVTLSDGSPLLKGRRITGFTAEEEAARKYDTIVPFELESALVATGASFSESPIFEPKVVVDGRIITGQNPASATPLGEAIVSALQDVK